MNRPVSRLSASKKFIDMGHEPCRAFIVFHLGQNVGPGPGHVYRALPHPVVGGVGRQNAGARPFGKLKPVKIIASGFIAIPAFAGHVQCARVPAGVFGAKDFPAPPGPFPGPSSVSNRWRSPKIMLLVCPAITPNSSSVATGTRCPINLRWLPGPNTRVWFLNSKLQIFRIGKRTMVKTQTSKTAITKENLHQNRNPRAPANGLRDHARFPTSQARSMVMISPTMQGRRHNGDPRQPPGRTCPDHGMHSAPGEETEALPSRTETMIRRSRSRAMSIPMKKPAMRSCADDQLKSAETRGKSIWA